MPAFQIDPSESALPSHLIPPPVGAPIAEVRAYVERARAAGVYRVAKAVVRASGVAEIRQEKPDTLIRKRGV